MNGAQQPPTAASPSSATSPNTLHKSRSTSTRASSRKTRVYAFRDFLIQHYGAYLQQQRQPSNDANTHDVVLDVAGGKGDLSWLLHNVDGIPSVVLDPRGDVSKCAIPKSVEYLQEHPQEAEQRAIPGLPTHQPLAVLLPKLVGKDAFVLPRHLPIRLDQELVDRVRDVVQKRDQSHEQWYTFWNAHASINGGNQDNNITVPLTTTTKANTAIVHADDALEALLNIKLVTGFHPDQATDYCIELAQVLNVPFCIVPCCVFPSEFPHRRLIISEEEQQQQRVQNYPQLIEYLREKCPEAQTGYLEFHFAETAKNLVLYTKPSPVMTY